MDNPKAGFAQKTEDELHSPEPWRTEIWCDGPIRITDANGKQVCGYITDFIGNQKAIPSSPIDLRRIAACVNACEGIPTEELERHGITNRQGM